MRKYVLMSRAGSSVGSITSTGLALAILLASAFFVAAPSASAQECDPVETHKLLASDGAAADFFGVSVAISGTTTIVGAHEDDDNGSNSGSTYLFDSTTGREIAKLLPNDGAEDDQFGWSVAISGTTVVVGAHGDDGNGSESGSAYLFSTTTGQQIAKLLPDDGAPDNKFGYSVAISGTTAIIGAPYDDDNGTDSGSAYLFSTTTGQQIAKLLPNDGAADDFFGISVGISGNTAVVGAWQDDANGTYSGSAYLFDITTGAQIAKLLPDDGAVVDQFGASVGISGTIAIVGAPYDDDNGGDSGSAYLFDTITGRQIAKLLPSDGAAFDYFGYSVAISPDGIGAIVGARLDDDVCPGEEHCNSGSAYLFDTTTGRQIAKILASDGEEHDFFGYSVAISDTAAIVGAYLDDDNGTSSGSAYVFGLTCTGLQLTVDATCPGGGPIQISWSGATPDGKAALIFALDLGGVVIPAGFPCQGTLIGLGPNQIQLVRVVSSNASGEGSLSGSAGGNACGGYLQLLDLATCDVSNVALIE